MATALDGVRILDLSSGPAAGLATMILADFGAEVLRIKKPGADPFDGLASTPMWRRGKRFLTLDLQTGDGMARLHRLAAGADVLVCSGRPRALRRLGLGFDELHERHQHLIVCHVNGFGSRGPYAELPGYEHVVAALSGRMKLFAGTVDRRGPVFSALQVGVHACAQATATGILAALMDRAGGGRGRFVETSLLRSMLAYEQGAMILDQFRARFPAFFAATQVTDQVPLPSLHYHPAQAADGRWLQFGNLLPHLFDNFLMVTGLVDVIADPDFDAQHLTLPAAKLEVFRERMLRRVQQRTAAEWMADFVDQGGVAATTYDTTQEALHNPDIVANGHVAERADGSVQLGPLARLSKTPGVPGSAERADDGLAESWVSTPRPAPSATASSPSGVSGMPLREVRVVEIATIIAAPLGVSVLADMGADVVKVEQIGGDPYRGFNGGAGVARVNQGKRSISVDLKTAAGREIVVGLIRDADLLVHNYRPGVAERLGIGYEQLTAINPTLVYLQVTGYGPDGPGALRPSTHPIPGAAMGGVAYQMGERLPEAKQDMDGLRLWTSRLLRANEVNPDPNTAMVVATSAMLGLAARHRHGQGQRILVDMLGANAYANHDDFLCYPGKPARALPDLHGYGLSPTYRLYRCAGDEWVFLALVTERDVVRFVELLRAAGFEGIDPERLRGGGDEIDAALAELFFSQRADYWQDLLAGAGVGCVRADAGLPSAFWLDDAHGRANDFTVAAVHPAWGAYRRPGPVVVFDGDHGHLGPPPLAGQHNAEVLSRLGYDAEHVASLESDGVLYREHPEG